MRKAFIETVSRLLDENPRVVVLLGDISVHAFREARAKHPKRVINCGVSEQAMVSMAAGLARAGMYPIVHTIAPFLVERAFEQIKIDFGYNELPGCFVSVGASYDYATLGATHHCPGDVALMLTIPNMEVYVPGHAEDLREILPKIADGACAYLRLSETQNPNPSLAVNFAMTNFVNPDSSTAVIAVGPTVGLVPDRANYFSLGRIDRMPTDFSRVPCRKFLVLEPFYTGTLTHLIADAFPNRAVLIRSIGVPRRFIRAEGSREDIDRVLGFTRENVALELERLLNA